MKKIALFLCLITSVGLAEEMPNNIHQTSSPVTNARYEIVVSSWMRKLSFRLDRYNGRVWMKVVDSKDNKMWESMYVEDHPWVTNSTHAHFQIFLSGIFASDTYLIDTDSGKTWTVVKDEKKSGEADGTERLIWQTIQDETRADAPAATVKP